MSTSEALSGEFPDTVDQDAKANKLASFELNQLKYVCRQLRNETQGLVLRDSELMFEGGLGQLKNFLCTVPASLVSTLRPVSVIPSFGNFHLLEDSSACEYLKVFCRQNPTFSIRVRHSWLDLSKARFFENAMVFALHLRKDRSFGRRLYLSPATHARYISWALEWSRGVQLIDNLDEYPPNFRVFPRTQCFDEMVLRRALHNDTLVARPMPGGIDAAIALASEILEHGI
jgi:hypothetical protein